MRTKKVGTSGRFRQKYGSTIRKEVAQIEKKQKAKHGCPSCKKDTLKRTSSGLWECASCSKKFTGGAYYPTTGALKLLKKSIASSKGTGRGV